MESPLMILHSAWRPASPVYGPQPCLEVYTSGGQACWDEPGWGCTQTPIWAAPPSQWQSAASYQVRGEHVRPMKDGWGASGPTTVKPPSSWWDDIHSRVSVQSSSWYSTALARSPVLSAEPGPRPAPRHKYPLDAIRYRPLPASLPLQDSRGRSGLVTVNPYRSPSAWWLDCGREGATWTQYSWCPEAQRAAWASHSRSTFQRAAHRALPAATVAAPWMRTLVHSILAPLVQFFTVACLLGYACLWTRAVVLDQRLPEGVPQRLSPAAYTGTARTLARMAWSLPAVFALASTPLVFDPVTQPFWVYLWAGVFAWWSAHKVLAACLDRGPLQHTRTLRETALVLLAPAAFVHQQPGDAPRQQGEKGTTGTHKHVQAAQAFLNEPPMVLLQRAVGKLCMALCLAIAMLRLRAAGIGSGAVSSSEASSSCWLNDVAFDLIVYSFFSLVMDGSASLLRSYSFGDGMALLPHFDQPWLSTSFREFWTRRWNLSAGRILRDGVYEPVVDAITHAWPHVEATTGSEGATTAASALQDNEGIPAKAATAYHALKRRAGSGVVEHLHLPHHHEGPSIAHGGDTSLPGNSSERSTQQAAGASTGESDGTDHAEQAQAPSIASSVSAVLPTSEQLKAVPAKIAETLSSQASHARHAAEHVDISWPAKLAGTLATFLVSGLMHEMILWYESRGVPVWSLTARAQAWSTAHESWPMAWLHARIIGRMPIFLHKFISKSAHWLLPPLYARAAGYMLCFFLANGVLCAYESILRKAWTRHGQGARLGYRGPLLGAPGTIHAKVVHTLLSTVVIGLQMWLAHKFWWAAFVHTGLDTRLMNEWAGWMKPLGLNLPQASQPMLCLA